MLHRNQASTMLELQAGMNHRVDPEWVRAAYPYLRAVLIEAAEAMEHHGWKWWKHQECDREQLQMELVDIWHFMLSDLLLTHQGEHEPSLDALLQEAKGTAESSIRFDEHNYQPGQMTLLDKLQLLAATAAAGRNEIGLFASIMADCEMDWDELYRQYTGKNVLNFFRQDNGYKEGHYRKHWAGQEDNEHLVDIMAELDPARADFKDRLYAALQARYLEEHTA